MALRGSSPVNLSALQRDYSALPKIAAIKAQANQGIFNAIQSGLEKRKVKIEKKQLSDIAIKMIQPLLSNPEFKKRFGTASADEVLNLIGDPREAIQLSENIIKATRAEEELARKIKQDKFKIRLTRQQILNAKSQRENALNKKASDNAFSNALSNVYKDPKHMPSPEDLKLMAPDQLSKFFEAKKEFNPDEIAVLEKEGGARIITRNGKYVAMYTVPLAADGKPTAAMADLENRVKFFKEIENDFREGRPLDAIQKLQAINAKTNTGNTPNIIDLPSAMGIVGLLLKDVSDQISEDDSSSKPEVTSDNYPGFSIGNLQD